MIVGVALVGCTRPNPSFGGDDVATSIASEGASTLDPTPGDTTTGGASATTAASTTTTAADGSTSAPDDTGPPTCELDFPNPATLTFSPPLDMPECNTTRTIGVEPGMFDGNAMGANTCDGGCPCEGTTVMRTVTSNVPPPLEPFNCYTMVLRLGDPLDPGPGPGPSCELEAYSYSDEENALVFVSNVVDPNIPKPFSFSLEGPAVMACEIDCQGQAPGYYALSPGSDDDIPPTGDPVTIPAGMADYEVRNLQSGIDAQCRRIGQWTAIISQ